MIEQQLVVIAAQGYRLVALCDQSVSGLGRWWATLQKLAAAGTWTKFGEGKSATEALALALASEPRFHAGMPMATRRELVQIEHQLAESAEFVATDEAGDLDF